ncbi:MAG: hypothetical protein GY820_19720 [Gammaproteobacteria bacterium]|nr:hypothetical protein [Gammaproteobacteria bacterium]
MQPASRVRFATRMVCRKGQFPVERDSSPQSTLWYTTVSALQKADVWLSIINPAATRCRNWQKSDVTEYKRELGLGLGIGLMRQLCTLRFAPRVQLPPQSYSLPHMALAQAWARAQKVEMRIDRSAAHERGRERGRRKK